MGATLEAWKRAARTDRAAGRLTARRFLLENGLSVVFLVLFLASWAAQAAAGFCDWNDERAKEGEPPGAFADYLGSGHFWAASAENWESEFLQMGAFAWLTCFLYQKGSPESRDPYEPDTTVPVTQRSPWPARRGGWARRLYERSLPLAFLALFLLTFALHVWGGARKLSAENAREGEPPVGMIEYLGTSRLWFESFQNWQSEFLAVAAMAVFAIWLRAEGSPESKSVATPHEENEDP